jgi:hypothetical protein
MLAVLGLAAAVVAGASAPPAQPRTPGRAALSPGPAGGYTVQSVCDTAPGRARCLSYRLVPYSTRAGAVSPVTDGRGRTTAKPATEGCTQVTGGELCHALRPVDLRGAYSIPEPIAPAGQTVAIVAAYDDPTALKDLRKYSTEFSLLPCSGHEHCFTKINQRGERRSPPPFNAGWAEEISLDIELVHAICENCHILLVEADTSRLKDLEAAEEQAAAWKPTVISNSWAAAEPATDSPAFDHKGIVITAASGDEGYLNWTGQAKEEAQEAKEKGEEVEEGELDVNYPASSPHVVAVGGTRLLFSERSWASEAVWNGDAPRGTRGGWGAGGSACSTALSAPYWQLELPDWSSVGCGSRRAVADIAADADPRTGAIIYDSSPDEPGAAPPGWQTMGGTSMAAPIIAGMFALAGGSGGVDYPARTLYENAQQSPSVLHDVGSGSNGSCEKEIPGPEGTRTCSAAEEGGICSERAICVARPGYDGPTGLGTPDGLGVFKPTGAPVKMPQQVQFTSAAPESARVGVTPYTVTASSSSGLPVSFLSASPLVCAVEGATVSFLGVGTCALEATQPGSSEFQPALPVEQSFSVAKGPQTITFTSSPPVSATVGAPPYTIAADASSGLPVTFATATPSVCAVEGSSVHFIAAGACTVTASQSGSASYEAAPDAQQTFTVTHPPELVSELPGHSSTSGGGNNSSGSLSFTSSKKPDNSFELTRKPKIAAHTGAVTFTVLVHDPGTLSWKLTLKDGSFGVATACPRREAAKHHCHAARIAFASGRMAAKSAGVISFSVHPGALARRALRAASAKGQSLRLQASLSFHSALGGTGTSQTHSVADRLHP